MEESAAAQLQRDIYAHRVCALGRMASCSRGDGPPAAMAATRMLLALVLGAVARAEGDAEPAKHAYVSPLVRRRCRSPAAGRRAILQKLPGRPAAEIWPIWAMTPRGTLARALAALPHAVQLGVIIWAMAVIWPLRAQAPVALCALAPCSGSARDLGLDLAKLGIDRVRLATWGRPHLLLAATVQTRRSARQRLLLARLLAGRSEPLWVDVLKRHAAQPPPRSH